MHLQQLKGMQGINLVCERGTICQHKVYEMGTFPVEGPI